MARRLFLRYCVERAVRAGARPAEPGEFTLRGYLNGRIDLPQAEAVRDLIDATTLYQARIAAQQVEDPSRGASLRYKEQLLELMSLLEAGIDFAEDDIDVASDEEILRRLAPIQEGIDRLARSFAYGKLVHEGFTLAIVGRPNVGKSSLFNRLLEQDRAIVTEIPGTTRDTVSETASLNGIPVRFVDTAGIRAGEDRVEQLGIERSYQAMADADLTLVVIDASQPLHADDEALLSRAGEPAGRREQGRSGRGSRSGGSIAVSALTGKASTTLRTRILQAITPEIEQEAGFITSVRHEALLREALESLDSGARRRVEQNPSRDAAAGPLQRATADRCDHRRDDGGRHPESHLLNVLHREVTEPTSRLFSVSNSFRTESSTPLTNGTDSSPENFRASSIASSITIGSWCFALRHFEDRHAEDVAIHGRHPLDTPSLRVLRNALVDLSFLADGPVYQSFHKRVLLRLFLVLFRVQAAVKRRDRLVGRERAHVALIKDLHGAMP